MLLTVRQKNTIDDIKLLTQRKIKEIKTSLTPCLFTRLKKDNTEFNILVNLNNEHVIIDSETLRGISLPRLERLSPTQLKILKVAIESEKFSTAELFDKSKVDLCVECDIKWIKDGKKIRPYVYHGRGFGNDFYAFVL